ncbi:MAG: hypothetical protein AB7S88_00380, partial [Candidatus Izemoplasmatales bacterium]
MNVRSRVGVVLGASAFALLGIIGSWVLFPILSQFWHAVYVAFFTAVPVIVFLSILLSKKRRFRISALEEKIRDMNALNKRLKNSEDIALNYLPVGMVIYDDNFTISWANNAAKEYFSNVLTGRKLSVVHDELAKLVEKREGKSIVSIYDKEYEMVHYPKNKCVYLFEVTEREDARKKLRDSMDVVGILSLDNFAEATQNFDFQEKTTIQGKYLSSLDNWCKKNNIYFVNLRPEKSVLLFHRSKLDELVKEEFLIMDEIAAISNQNEIRVSLSMGIASGDLASDELGDRAEEALKLALGRGGDQVVVNIQNQPLRFFGGKSNTAEKRTKITARINSRALSELLQKHSQVFIMPHKMTDIDALGGAVGLLQMALAEGCDAKIVLDFDFIDQTTQKVVDMLN